MKTKDKLAEGTASYEATNNEELIKHKNVSVEKYNSFIKNYEEQLSYFKNEYNSRHKKNICKTIITSFFLITSVLLLILAFKAILKPLDVFTVLGSLFGVLGFLIGQSLSDYIDITDCFYSSIKKIQENYKVQENIIKNNNFNYFINTSKDKDSFIWDIEYSEGFLCKDYFSHNNGTVELTEYRDSQSIWNEENIDLKTHYEEIIDLSDNHILSVEEIKAHSHKDNL